MPDRSTRRLHGSRCASSLLGLAASLAIAGTALAGWAGFGGGIGHFTVATLGAPVVTATPTAGGADLSWTAVAAPGGADPVQYKVQRDGVDAAGSCPTDALPAAVTSCADTGLAIGTYSYTVVAVFHSWTAASAPVSAEVTVGGIARFRVTAATTSPTAGAPFSITIAALDANGTVVTDYTGSHCLHFTGPGASPNGTNPSYTYASGACTPGDPYVPFVNGSATFAVTFYRAQSFNLQVTDTIGHDNGAGLHFSVGPAVAASLAVSDPGTVTAGVAFSLSLNAKDAYGNNATGLTGTRCLVFSGPSTSLNGDPPVYPARGSCAPGQSEVDFTQGTATGVSMTLYAVGSPTHLDVRDAGTGATGHIDLNLGAGALAALRVTNPGTAVAGRSFDLTVTPVDAYGNPAVDTGTCLAFSGAANSPTNRPPDYPAGGSCPSGYSAVSLTNGAFVVPMTLYNAASTTLSVTDGTRTAATTFNVTGGDGARFQASVAQPVVVAGTPDLMTITAYDQWGNVAAGYTGSHSLVFSGTTALNPSPFSPSMTNASGAQVSFGNATPISFGAGVATSTMRLYRGGSFKIVVSDGSINNGTGMDVTVQVVATAVATGVRHSCAVLSYGGVECWGSNSNGQLGDGTTTSSATPVAVSSITNATAVAAGLNHTCVLLADGTLRCWGAGGAGQLGNNGNADSSTPVQVANITSVAGISAGGLNTCAVQANGNAWCWGSNSHNALGNGNNGGGKSAPDQVSAVAGATVVSTGYDHSCALLSNGTVKCWGNNTNGELGDASTTDRRSGVLVSGLAGAASIGAGYAHTCAVTSGGATYCWGLNANGQLGDGTTTQRTTPVVVGGSLNARAVAAGEYHTCALLVDQTVWCWGLNNVGQLGDGTTATRTSPVRASGVAGATRVSAGGDTGPTERSVALLSSGSVWSWGDTNASPVALQ